MVIGYRRELLLPNLPIDFIAVMGISGMLNKNSVVRVFQIDLDRADAKPVGEAVKSASILRGRPLRMIAMKTVLVMALLLLDTFYASMAIPIVSRLSFATVLTLIVAQVQYILLFLAERD